MSNKCKIYYGIIVNESGDDWAKLGYYMEEPVKVEGRDPIGKSPEFCCEYFAGIYTQGYFSFYSHPIPTIKLSWRNHYMGGDGPPAINFCPFCAAKIIMLEDLKLNVVKTPCTVASYHVEIA